MDKKAKDDEQEKGPEEEVWKGGRWTKRLEREEEEREKEEEEEEEEAVDEGEDVAETTQQEKHANHVPCNRTHDFI